MISLSNLKPARGSKKKSKRIGRGTSSGRGTYSGKGQKGQRARSGGRKGLKFKGIRYMIKRLPKIGGFRSIYSRPEVVKLSDLEKKFNDGDIVNAIKLLNLGLISGRKAQYKIIGTSKTAKKLIVYTHLISKSTENLIKKNGGEVTRVIK